MAEKMSPDKFMGNNTGAMVMKFALDQVAKKGRKGDTELGHLTKNDRVIPAEIIKGELKSDLDAVMKKHGLDPERYSVGSKKNSIHPETGLPEFYGEGGSGGGEPGGGGTGADTAGGGGGTGASGGGGTGPSGGGDKSGGTVGSGGGAQTDSGPGPGSTPDTGTGTGTGPGAPGGKMGGEIGTGHGSGASIGGTGFGGGVADPGLPEGAQAFTGINAIDRALNAIAAHPMETAVNLGFGFIPGMQVPAMINSASGMFGGPTVGGMVTGAVNAGEIGEPSGNVGAPGGGSATLDDYLKQLSSGPR